MSVTHVVFRTLRKRLAPRWLTDGDGELIGYSLDVVKDAFAQRLGLGLLARFPQNGPNGETAPFDALPIIGRDRRVVRGLFESDSTYAERLLRWLDDRKRCGNPYALMQKLAEYLGPLPSFRTVDARGNWYSRAADGTESALLKQENWDWSGEPIGERWSRFWVIIYPNGLWSESSYDWGDVYGTDWGARSDETWGSTATQEHVTTVQSIVADWMPAGTRCINIIVAFDPDSFDPADPEPDGLWERWGKNAAGIAVPARLSTARYWDGPTPLPLGPGGVQAWAPPQAAVPLVGWYLGDVGISGATWTDQSGASNDLTLTGSPSAGAGVGGHATLAFNGTTQYARRASFALGAAGNISIFAVLKMTGSVGSSNHGIASYSDSAFDGQFLGTSNNKGGVGNEIAGIVEGTTLLTTTWRRVGITGATGGTQYLYVANAEEASQATTATIASNLAFAVGARADGSLPSPVDVAEVVVYRGVLSVGDRASLDAYFAEKFGL